MVYVKWEEICKISAKGVRFRGKVLKYKQKPIKTPFKGVRFRGKLGFRLQYGNKGGTFREVRHPFTPFLYTFEA